MYCEENPGDCGRRLQSGTIATNAMRRAVFNDLSQFVDDDSADSIEDQIDDLFERIDKNHSGSIENVDVIQTFANASNDFTL